MEPAHRGREEAIGRIRQDGGAAFAARRRGDVSTWIIQRGSKNRQEFQSAGAKEENQRALRKENWAEHQQQEDAEEDYPSKGFLDHGSPRGPQQHNGVSVSSGGSHLEK